MPVCNLEFEALQEALPSLQVRLPQVHVAAAPDHAIDAPQDALLHQLDRRGGLGRQHLRDLGLGPVVRERRDDVDHELLWILLVAIAAD